MYPIQLFSQTTIRYSLLRRSIGLHSCHITRAYFSQITNESTSSPKLHLIQKGILTQESVENFIKTSKIFSKVHFDLGAGDGKFVYRQARQHPENFYVGVEPSPDAMYYISQKVARKPSKGGGVHNTAFIQSSVENLPLGPPTIADSISINFPWATLLKGVVTPLPSMLDKIAQLGKNQAKIEIVLNYTVFANTTYVEKIGLPILNENYLKEHLLPEYQKHGIKIESFSFDTSTKNKSSWGQHLTLGAGRKVLFLTGKIDHRSLE